MRYVFTTAIRVVLTGIIVKYGDTSPGPDYVAWNYTKNNINNIYIPSLGEGYDKQDIAVDTTAGQRGANKTVWFKFKIVNFSDKMSVDKIITDLYIVEAWHEFNTAPPRAGYVQFPMGLSNFEDNSVGRSLCRTQHFIMYKTEAISTATEFVCAVGGGQLGDGKMNGIANNESVQLKVAGNSIRSGADCGSGEYYLFVGKQPNYY